MGPKDNLCETKMTTKYHDAHDDDDNNDAVDDVSDDDHVKWMIDDER